MPVSAFRILASALGALEGETVSVFLRERFPGGGPRTGLPPGSGSVASGVVDSFGYVTFAGLAYETRYVAGLLTAEAGWRYASFQTPPEATGGSGSAPAEEARALLAEAKLQPKSERGKPEGYPSLDSSGMVPAAQLPFQAIDPGGEVPNFLSYAEPGRAAWAELPFAQIEGLISSLARPRGTFRAVSASGTLPANSYNNVTVEGTTHTPQGSGMVVGDWLTIHNASGGLVTVVILEPFILPPGRTIVLQASDPTTWRVVGEHLPLFNGGLALASSKGAGATLYSGTGAPSKPQGTASGTALKAGDLYFRYDKPTGVKERLYICTKTSGSEAENWEGIV